MSRDADLESGTQRAVVLLSGGLDSVTLLAEAMAAGRRCHALTFDYGQRHRSELVAAQRIANHFRVVEHRCVDLNLTSLCASALTDPAAQLPERLSDRIPPTYVPARNTIFLAIALGWAETLAADEIMIGVNCLDYSGYPDCRPRFIDAFQHLADCATKRAVEGAAVTLRTPLLQLDKAAIIRRGLKLGVDYSLTMSCYNGTIPACGKCDSCRLRLAAFAKVGISDPLHYVAIKNECI